MKNRSPLRITLAMLRAGEAALELARQAEHAPRATCHVIFTAMLAESDWSPALRKRGPMLAGRVMPKHPLTRDYFDADGVHRHELPGGGIHYALIWNYWYLRDAWEAEKAAKKITNT